VLIVADSKDVVDNNIEFEKQFIEDVKKRKIKGILVINKIDLQPFDEKSVEKTKNNLDFPVFSVSSVKKTGITELKNFIAKKASGSMTDPSLIGDLIEKNDLIFLVCPIDNAAPKGRMILPQVQVIRDVLDNDGIAIVMKDTELEESFKKLGKPKLVITDSQAFKKVSALTAEDVMLTSFSIVFARQKGNLEILKKGVRKIDKLQNGDKILVAEACTHHCQSDDIGRYKIPAWLREKTGKNLTFEYATGGDFPANLKDYALVVHCGGCMINRREMLYRLEFTEEKGVPIVNYGLLIAYVNGIFERAIKVFN
jgi:[FeFe] hydrogenase H-cluster maturation GTPase HydF